MEAVPRIAEIADVGEVESGTFSLEAALATRSDVAIFAAWQYNAMGDAADRTDAAGVPVVVLDYNAQEVEKHVVLARVVRAEIKPRVYVELGRKGADEVDNSYGNTMWGKLVASAGSVAKFSAILHAGRFRARVRR